MVSLIAPGISGMIFKSVRFLDRLRQHHTLFIVRSNSARQLVQLVSTVRRISVNPRSKCFLGVEREPYSPLPENRMIWLGMTNTFSNWATAAFNIRSKITVRVLFFEVKIPVMVLSFRR